MDKQNTERCNQPPQSSQRSAEYIMAKIQQVIPDLRRQVAEQLRDVYRNRNKQILREKREQFKRVYQEKIEVQMRKINDQIKSKMMTVQNQYEQKKADLASRRNKKKTLTKQQEEDIVQETVANILNDSEMLQQVKRKIEPRVRQRIHMMLDYQMDELCEKSRQQMENQSQQNKKQWTESRTDYWKKQSKGQLQILAQEYKQLQAKKNIIEESLQNKKLERQNVRKRLRQAIQHNQEVVRIKQEINQLELSLS